MLALFGLFIIVGALFAYIAGRTRCLSRGPSILCEAFAWVATGTGSLGYTLRFGVKNGPMPNPGSTDYFLHTVHIGLIIWLTMIVIGVVVLISKECGRKGKPLMFKF